MDQGVRRFETRAAGYREALSRTVAQPNTAACLTALEAARGLYLELHGALGWPEIDHDTANAVSAFLDAARAE